MLQEKLEPYRNALDNMTEDTPIEERLAVMIRIELTMAYIGHLWMKEDPPQEDPK
jgi:hypothetical protein